MPGTEPKESTKREQFEKQAQSLCAGYGGSIDRLVERQILVCGWRKRWSESGTHFRNRVEDLTEKLKGTKSSVTFLNNLDSEDFTEVMRLCKFHEKAPMKLGGDWPDFEVKCWDMGGGSFDGIEVRFVHGDASDGTKLLPILTNFRINTAVCLGSHATQDIPAKSRDTRVLTTMLVLRHTLSKIASSDRTELHIVGENEFDMTAQLALAPRKSKGQTDRPSDFVNAQAIQARVLVQTLAFPQLNVAVSELFKSHDGFASVQIYEADQFLPLGTDISFGAVQQIMAMKEDKRTIICIGIIGKDGKAVLMPSFPKLYEEGHKYEAGEQLICIMREPLPAPGMGRQATFPDSHHHE
jgi:hypothetical protein